MEYFIDQYGHIYLWQDTAEGKVSVSVANFQKHGSCKESVNMIEQANNAPDLLAALEELHEYTRGSSAAYRNGIADTDPLYSAVHAAISRARGLP